jgi:hypothetical protein
VPQAITLSKIMELVVNSNKMEKVLIKTLMRN